MNSISNIRFGIVGTGRITRRLVADLQSTDGVDVTAIASRTDDRAKWYADQYGIAAAVTGYEELLKLSHSEIFKLFRKIYVSNLF